MKQTIRLRLVFGVGVLFGFLFLPVSSYFGGSLDQRAMIGGSIGSLLGVALIVLALALKSLLKATAIGTVIAAFWAWQQAESGFVTYVSRAGSNPTPIDWRVHPSVAFYTITWCLLTLPALYFYCIARFRRP